MITEVPTFKNEVAQIFNPRHKAEILEKEITSENIKSEQVAIIQTYLQEQKLDAIKVFQIIDEESRDLTTLINTIKELELKQDFLSNNEIDSYSYFLDTADLSGSTFSINFAGFSLYERRGVGEENETVWIPSKEFSIFRLKFYINPVGGKLCARLELKNRRRVRNQINYFREEVEFVKNWIRSNLAGMRLKLIDVRDFYYKHKFDSREFEQLGYYVSDILDDFDENLPVELKFKPTKNHLKPSDIYFEIDKHVRNSLNQMILSSIGDLIGPDSRGEIEEKLKTLKYSKYFFESAYKAFEKGVGHLRKIEKVDDKDIAFRFDFPQNESGVIKVDNQNGGKYLEHINNELNKYLSTLQ
ncbi:hypothetical protein M902_1816 [Bacteriovorax sp. BAL6_X]|uniref:hypothetical protein n=1 Tax=Bacteriovorax sp. BAL6_X TaxID=1201290 RepID=UPI0003861D3A|nr:hypothetical protein [Bacteriovorax sp. BAL6_X]EPZ52025.1 hypothetical protein M902_1816 [Bacteriovorax sp. BAL6_X]